MPHTRASLAAALSALGLHPGDTVMFHASLRSLGPVLGGAAEIIRALLDTVGPTGNLAAYLDYEPFHDDDEPNPPVYDKLTAPAARDHGVLHEAFRTWPGTLVSDHPGARVAALGPLAGHIVEPHPELYGYGPGTPFERLHLLNTKILMLAAPLDTITMLHYAEHLAHIPDKVVIRYRRLLPTLAGPAWLDFEEFDTSEPCHPRFPENLFEQIAVAALTAGLGRSSPLGHLFESHSLIPFAVHKMENWPTLPSVDH